MDGLYSCPSSAQNIRMNDTANPNQIFARAKAAHDAGNATEAETLYKQLLDIAPGHPDVLHLLGVLYGQTGQFDSAIKAISEAIEKVPGDPNYQYNYGNVLVQMKRWREAATAFNKSLEIAPDNPDAAFNLTLALKQGGQLDDAEQAFRRVISLNENHAEALAELSESLGRTGELDEAISLQERAIALKPETANFHFNFGMLLLKNQDWDNALKCFNETLTRQRWHVPALAAKAIVLHETHDDEAATTLLDHNRLISVQTLSLPDGLNTKTLGDLLATHPSCVWERSDTTTRAGAQTDNLAKDSHPTIVAFIEVLTEKIEVYVRAKSSNPSHPFSAQIPESWDYSIWATILNEDGHQDPHLYPAAWVSGVYYLEVPDAITTPENTNEAGWIEFGAPGYGITPVRPPNVRRIMPKAGKLVFFPSYFFHRTVPLSGTARRISIAFDVIPTKWRK